MGLPVRKSVSRHRTNAPRTRYQLSVALGSGPFFMIAKGSQSGANAKPFVIMVEGALQRDADGVGAGRRGWRGGKG
jgi:hypothetical protein